MNRKLKNLIAICVGILPINVIMIWYRLTHSEGFTTVDMLVYPLMFGGGNILLILALNKYLLNEKSKEEQENYFDNVWNTKRFHYMFRVLFNKRMLAKRGLVAEYFQFDDGSKSFAESFYNRSKKAFRNIPVKGNYFLALYLNGKYRNDKIKG